MVHSIAQVIIAIIVLIHCYIMYFEMFAWTTLGRKIFKHLPADLFEPTKVFAGNQGLYNGFLAAGLIWTFFITDAKWQFYISVFFLSCVAIAGIYGALTASKRIFYIQALPAITALVLLHF
jgi:putative membrane protein